MPKYYDFKVAGYYLYFTSFCVIECMHVHASDSKLTEGGSAKFFVKNNGDSVLQNRGILNDREIAKISEFIKDHYQEMYLRWSQYSEKGYYEKWYLFILEIRESMDYDARWKVDGKIEVVEFINTNHHNPPRHRIEEHDMLNWLKATRKWINAGELKSERVELFGKLLEQMELYKRKDQYV